MASILGRIGPIPDYHDRIGTYDFRVISDKLSEAYDLPKKSLIELTKFWSIVDQTKVNPLQRHKQELQSYLSSTYAFIISEHLANPQSFLNIIRNLNDYILDKYGQAYGYSTMDEFLEDQFLEVPITYAILSEFTGQVITKIGESRARHSDINKNHADIKLPFNKIGWQNI